MMEATAKLGLYDSELTETEERLIAGRLARQHEAIEVDLDTMEPLLPAKQATIEAIEASKAGQVTRTTLEDL